ncbi:chaperonin 10-like protein [Schizophyllum amplum]|uniref:Chaperonin 10-like protein n=1 Tax=Schizophyllum amplum TaxID=97359 RepID=A0A550CPV2_9AGAR|nr:chaperonin 10-like protein [Auriculariopsis ampla]
MSAPTTTCATPSTHRAAAALSPGHWDIISVPTAAPGSGEVLIKVEYVGMIPFDTYVADLGYHTTEWPMVLGFSCAGTVARVGEGVPGLDVGDRVTAFSYVSSRSKGLQEYSVQPYQVVAKLPADFPLDGAATIPDNLVTAFYTLFNQCGLPRPAEFPVRTPPAKAALPILVYGAGSSSGQYTVQLLRAAGYTNVLATASAHNHAALREMGAKHVFDYRSKTMAEEIEQAVGGKVALVVDCISTETTLEAVGKVLAPDGAIALLLPVKDGSQLRGAPAEGMYFEVPDHMKGYLPEGVKKLLVRTFLYQNDEYLKENLMPKILPQLLEKGIIHANPVRLMAEGTLKERIEVAMDLLRNNKVSREKLVVKIDHE